MKLNLISTKEILDFEKEIGYELVVTERAINSSSSSRLHRYYAQFHGAEVKDGVCLAGVYGNGNSIDQAIIDYCQQVSNRRVVFSAYSEMREIQFPKLVHTKLLGR